jgi:hypothetical protein
MKPTPAPIPAEQIAFLGDIERLLSGRPVRRHASLVAIADLAVQLGSDDISN